MAKLGKLDQIDPKIYISSYFQLKAIAKDHQVVPPRSTPKKCLWYWGEPRTGKTRRANEEYPGAYKKLQNKWFDGYDNHSAVILDDLGKETAKFLTTHIKLWADPWNNQPAETKGGQITLCYDVFVVTSNYHPFDLWEGVDLTAIEARFEIIKIEKQVE